MSSIMTYNGAAVIAMAGKNCVAIASDHVYGADGQMVAVTFPKVFRMGPRLFIGLAGLITDIQTVVDNTRATVNLYELSRHGRIKPSTLAGTLSSMLYQKRFGPYYIQSIVAGLEPKTNVPYLASLDLFGSKSVRPDFVVNGTCKTQLYGMCEALWKRNMNVEALFEAVSQCLLSSCDSDSISGWGATVYVIEPNKVTKRTLRARMD